MQAKALPNCGFSIQGQPPHQHCLLLPSANNIDLQVGSIPKELSTCTSLEVLYLHDNRLWGKIPDSLRALRGLRYLNLHRVSHDVTVCWLDVEKETD